MGQNCPIVQFDTMPIQSRAQPMKNSKPVNDNCLRKWITVFSSLQAVIIPCGLTATLPDEEKTKLLNTCSALEGKLKDAGIRAKGDYRDNYSPGWKFNHWELKVLLFGNFGIIRSFSEAVGSSSRMIGYFWICCDKIGAFGDIFWDFPKHCQYLVSTFDTVDAQKR